MQLLLIVLEVNDTRIKVGLRDIKIGDYMI